MMAQASNLQGAGGAEQSNRHYPSNREPLTPSPLVQLPIGSIKTTGWLRHQLQLQIDGLTGHMDELFDQVGPNSAWLGGNGEDWERGPYYLRGLTALAYATGDERMLAKVKPWIEWSLNSQKDNGYFGPDKETPLTRFGEGYNDWWPRMIMVQIIEMHYEATGDKRVIPFLTKYYKYQLTQLPKQPLRSWAERRGGDNSTGVYWLYNRTGDKFLLDVGKILIEQTNDWTSRFGSDEPIEFHVVNLSQGYKQPGVIYQQTHDPKHRKAVFDGARKVMREHGRIDGMHSGDEAQGGLGSTRGTELCAVVEMMHSLETLLEVFGDAGMADRLEKVAFNALPALCKPDWRGHQYFSQPNQVLCTREKHGFTTDHGDDLTLGVLTGYPCCATNMHMGWPKLAHHLWMATPDNGLATVVYAPCEVTAKVADGQEVTIVEETEYPFKENVTLRIKKANAAFPLVVRIPGWCNAAKIHINNEKGPAAKAGTFVKLERTWKSGDVVKLHFPMEIRTSAWENNSVGIERGPLAFALAVEEEWRKFPDWHRGDVEDDWPQWEVHPKSAWNYGLIIDRDNPKSLKLEVRDVPDQPFAPDDAPVRITAEARKIPDWKLNEHKNAAAVPKSPVKTSEPKESVTLLPFGATRLRVAYIPVVEE